MYLIINFCIHSYLCHLFVFHRYLPTLTPKSDHAHWLDGNVRVACFYTPAVRRPVFPRSARCLDCVRGFWQATPAIVSAQLRPKWTQSFIFKVSCRQLMKSDISQWTNVLQPRTTDRSILNVAQWYEQLGSAVKLESRSSVSVSQCAFVTSVYIWFQDFFGYMLSGVVKILGRGFVWLTFSGYAADVNQVN